MRRADRFLQIIQIFRRRGGIITAAHLAEELEVSVRTIYRDMSALMASGVPVTGEASVGYVLDKSYDLPPLMFSIEEVEAMVLGARFVGAFSQDDPQMLLAAGNALAKIEAVLSADRKAQMTQINLIAGLPNIESCGIVDMAELRQIIRSGHKVELVYTDGQSNKTTRIIWPLAIGYFGLSRLLVAWCEKREAVRNFRLDRIRQITRLSIRAPHTRQKIYRDYAKQQLEQGGRFLA
ncbi:MAG: YafY family transcriptional regulator [Robiginitomaculum sp.]|nr:YafY family transcriptional regulator [Robiginitomaculum sp.]